jgi:nitrous oxidase accessory protein NosD
MLGAAAVAGMVIALGTATATAAPSTLFVSVLGSDANPCSSAQPCKTIGHAVAVAQPGNAIDVASGTYFESVTIEKLLKLSGHGAVINAVGRINGIVISGPAAAGTTLRHFTVENASGEGVLAVGTSDLTIAHNEVVDNDTGTNTPVTPECAEQGNVPGDCGEGLHLMGVAYSKILNNYVHRNVGGILVTDEVGPSHGNLIAYNRTTDNHEDCGITLPSHNALALTDPSQGGVYDNTVLNNVSKDNGGAGVGMFAPFPGTASYDNHVIGNTLTGNGEAGVGIHAHAPQQNVSGNVITGNYLAGNGVDPDSNSGHPVGIALFSAVVPVSVKVSHNQMSDSYYGVFINGPVSVTGLPTNSYGPGVTVRVKRV